MSAEQVKAFLAKVRHDITLEQRLNAAAAADAVVVIAREAGFMISLDDLKSAQTELEDAELEAAAGGIQPFLIPWLLENLPEERDNSGYL